MAEEARLAKPMVKRRVPDLADMVLAALAKTPIDHPVAVAVAELIRERCENVRDIFRRE